jgi:predicted dehydrogenase
VARTRSGVPFNPNRWGVKTATFPTFRYFWDYAGGAMTDWGVHLIDPIHQCFDDPMPLAVTAMGSKFHVQDNTQTPDSTLATFITKAFFPVTRAAPATRYRCLGSARAPAP